MRLVQIITRGAEREVGEHTVSMAAFFSVDRGLPCLAARPSGIEAQQKHDHGCGGKRSPKASDAPIIH